MKGEQGSDDDEEEEDDEEDMNDEDEEEDEEEEEEEEEDYEEEDDEDEDEEVSDYRTYEYSSPEEESHKEQDSEQATSDHSHVRNLVLSPQYRTDAHHNDVVKANKNGLNGDDSEDEEYHRKTGAATSKLRSSQRNLTLPQSKDSHSPRYVIYSGIPYELSPAGWLDG